MAGRTLEWRVADLEARLAKLEKLLSLSSDGSVTVAAPKITLNSPIIEVKAANSLTLESGASMILKSGLSVTVKSGSTIYLEGSNATMKSNSFSIQASGGASVSGDSMLILNKGTRPLARAGDAITASGAPAGMAGVIVPSASTVLG
jgi:hypothetical protein